MQHSTHLSERFVSCQLEWRPSRWLMTALAAMGGLAAISAFYSDISLIAAVILALLALVCSTWQVHRLRAAPNLHWYFPGNDWPVTLNGLPVDALKVQWRGPLAFVSWCDKSGRRRHCTWWPDTMTAAQRRELRLAVSAGEPTRHVTSMAT